MPQAKPKQTLYYIPHTHWEGAVFFTREEYLQMGLSNILSAMRLLEKYPEYKFTLDQVEYFRPFLERYPELAPEFRKFVKDGRLGIVGGMDVMPDDVKPGGEIFVRQIQYGKGYCREALGIDVKTAWLLDTFGHHPQMPQLLKLAGFDSFWFCRGQSGKDTPSEFLWKGIDGSTIQSMWLPGFYGLFYGPPRTQIGFDRDFTNNFFSLNSHTHYPDRVGLAGNDVSEPEDYVPPLVDHFNSEPDAPFKIRYSIPSDFTAIVAKRTDVPVLTGDFNPIFQGTYSSRIELKQRTRQIEQELLTAEKLGAISDWLGSPTDSSMTWRAWEPVLFNQTHDLASGVMADHVYTDVVRGYDFSERLANEMIDSRWASVAAHVDTRGEGTPVIVLNPLGMRRDHETVQVNLGFGDSQAVGLSVIGPDGKQIPCQLDYAERYGDESLKRAKISFAPDVPALGYGVYHVIAKNSGAVLKEIAPSSPDVDTIENEAFKVRVDTKTGAILSVLDKSGGEILSAPGNVVARQNDNGDLWELYHTLDGTSYIPASNKQPVPNASNALLSTGFSAKPGTLVEGPVYSEFSVSHPFGTGTFSTRIRLTKGGKRVDIETTLVNNEKHVRYQVLFPTQIKGGKDFQEIPFGAVERPLGVEYPAQTWVDCSDAQSGVSLLNLGMPGNVVAEDGTLMLSLLRSQTLGDYNEGHTSVSGFELGIPQTFHYSLYPHSGSWQTSAVVDEAHETNCPMTVFKAEAHGGSLPARWGMVTIDQPNVCLTTFKPGPDHTAILRVYETAGRATHGVKLRLSAKVLAANEANLMEDTGAKLAPDGDTIAIDLHPYEIKTLKLKLAPAR